MVLVVGFYGYIYGDKKYILASLATPWPNYQTFRLQLQELPMLKSKNGTGKEGTGRW
jgi:hypothetical protein